MLRLIAPRYWGGHVAMLLAVAAATGLGLWQLNAWSAHRAAEARDLANAAPVALAQVMSGDDPFPGRDLGRPVTFSGTWLGKDTLYVSDRRLDGRTGFWVVTPVRVDATDSAMPVVRGWSARATAPAVDGKVRLTGWLQASEGSGYLDDDPHDDVIPEMRIASLVEHVDEDLYSGYVVTRQATRGLVQVTPASIPKVSGFTALRNLLYAFEWWIFGGFAVFIWWRWCRDELAAASATSAADSASEEQQAAH